MVISSVVGDVVEVGSVEVRSVEGVFVVDIVSVVCSVVVVLASEITKHENRYSNDS